MFRAKKWGFEVWSWISTLWIFLSFRARMWARKDRKDTIFVFELRNFSTHNTKKRRTQHTCAQHTNTAAHRLQKPCEKYLYALRADLDLRTNVGVLRERGVALHAFWYFSQEQFGGLHGFRWKVRSWKGNHDFWSVQDGSAKILRKCPKITSSIKILQFGCLNDTF